MLKITDFFNNDYVNFSSYDNLRKIASVIDGQKNASRKIIYTILEKNINQEIKVSQLGSKVAEFAEYLHGNMDGVIVGLAQNYPGSNNIPLLVREGNFGTRFSPEASASRYIYTHGSSEFFELFNKLDNDVLKHQFFEGSKIEPMFFVPSLPLILINGSEGVSSGFAQKILPRNPKNIIKIIKYVLSGSNEIDEKLLVPYYEGFDGTIEHGENPNQWLIKGKIVRKGINKIDITEVPVGYDLKSYIDILDDLEDKKIIQGYRDKSENNKFLFEVSIPSKDLKDFDDEQLLVRLKLVKKISENYTTIDENNKIKVFNNTKEIIEHFLGVKLDFMNQRKVNELRKMQDQLNFDLSKYLFIKNIVEDKLVINKRKKDDIIKDIRLINGIVEKDGSFDYLLNMGISSLTEERMDKLLSEIKCNKQAFDDLTNTSIRDMYLNELQSIAQRNK